MKKFNRGNDRRGGNFGHRDRQMHKAVCAACHKDCEVPFRPTTDKPIYCSECFSKQGGGNNRQNKFGGDRDRRPRFEGGGEDKSKEILKGIKTLNYKIDELTKVLANLTVAEKVEEEKPKTKTTETKNTAKKTTKKVASKTTAKKKTVAKKTTKKKAPAKKKTTTKKATSKKK